MPDPAPEAPRHVLVEWDAYRQFLDAKFRAGVRDDVYASVKLLGRILGLSGIVLVGGALWFVLGNYIDKRSESAAKEEVATQVAVQLATTAQASAQQRVLDGVAGWVQQNQRQLVEQPAVQAELQQAVTLAIRQQIGGLTDAAALDRRVARLNQPILPDEVRLAVLADVRDVDPDGVRITREITQLLRPDLDGSLAELRFRAQAAKTAIGLMDDPRLAPRWHEVQDAGQRWCLAKFDEADSDAVRGDLAQVLARHDPGQRELHRERLTGWMLTAFGARTRYSETCIGALARAAGQLGGNEALALADRLLAARQPLPARAGLRVLAGWQPTPDTSPELAETTLRNAIRAAATLLAAQPPPHLLPGADPRRRQDRLAWMLLQEASMQPPRPRMMSHVGQRYPGADAELPVRFRRALTLWQGGACASVEDRAAECEPEPASARPTSGLAASFESWAWRPSMAWLRDLTTELHGVAARPEVPAMVRQRLAAALAADLRAGTQAFAGAVAPTDAEALAHGLALTMLGALDPAGALTAGLETLTATGLAEHPAIVRAVRAIVLARPRGPEQVAAIRAFADRLLAPAAGRESAGPLLTWLLARLAELDRDAAVAWANGVAPTLEVSGRRWQGEALAMAWTSGPDPTSEPPASFPAQLTVATARELGSLLEQAGAPTQDRAAMLAAALLPTFAALRSPEEDSGGRALRLDLLRLDLSADVRAAGDRSANGPGALAPALARLDAAFWALAMPQRDAEPLSSDGCGELKLATSAFRFALPANHAAQLTVPARAGAVLIALETGARRVELSDEVPVAADRASAERSATLSILPADRPRDYVVRLDSPRADAAGARGPSPLCVTTAARTALAVAATADRPTPAQLAAAPLVEPAADRSFGFTLPAGSAAGLVRLQPAAGTLLVAETQPPTGVDTELEVLSLAGRQLAYDDDGGAGRNLSRVRWRATGEPVALRFGLYGGAAVTRATPIVAAIATTPLPMQRATAGAPVAMTVPDRAAERWVVVPLRAGQGYVARTTGLAEGVDTTIRVERGGGELIGENDDVAPGLGSCVAFTPMEAADHFFLLRNIGGGTGAFRFVVAEGAACG